MTTVEQQHETPKAFEPFGPRARGFLLRAGWIRATWCTALFFLVGMFIVVGSRAIFDMHPVYNWTIITLTGALTMAPLGFLTGIGAFDYWFYWISGRPTREEDHSGHGAKAWPDYFRINTDHKVIGVQYTVTTFFFFVIGGLMAMLFRAELAQPGLQFFSSQTFNGLQCVLRSRRLRRRPTAGAFTCGLLPRHATAGGMEPGLAGYDVCGRSSVGRGLTHLDLPCSLHGVDGL